MDETKAKLKRMALWTTAIFASIFAVTFTILWLPIYPISGKAVPALGQVFAAGWPILVLDLVLCAGVYFSYKFYLTRQK
jgi:hypothetical protein